MVKNISWPHLFEDFRNDQRPSDILHFALHPLREIFVLRVRAAGRVDRQIIVDRDIARTTAAGSVTHGRHLLRRCRTAEKYDVDSAQHPPNTAYGQRDG